jgi:hypothetical protein
MATFCCVCQTKPPRARSNLFNGFLRRTCQHMHVLDILIISCSCALTRATHSVSHDLAIDANGVRPQHGLAAAYACEMADKKTNTKKSL